jgi:hypothetical protein
MLLTTDPNFAHPKLDPNIHMNSVKRIFEILEKIKFSLKKIKKFAVPLTDLSCLIFKTSFLSGRQVKVGIFTKFTMTAF